MIATKLDGQGHKIIVIEMYENEEGFLDGGLFILFNLVCFKKKIRIVERKLSSYFHSSLSSISSLCKGLSLKFTRPKIIHQKLIVEI